MRGLSIGVVCLISVLAQVPLASQPAQPERVAVSINKGAVVFRIDGKEAGTYRTEGFSKPILWPVYAPGQISVTRDWPMGDATPGGSKDHPHQQSIWFCHGDVIPKGIDLKAKVKGVDGVDFWSLSEGHGNIVCTDVKKGKLGPTWAGIDTTNEWRTSDGVKILDERRIVALHDLGQAWLWVFDIDLTASVCPIQFGDTKEGAMAVRVHDHLREKGGSGTIHNADGKTTEKECWGQKSAWCDYSGTLQGKNVGIAILDDSHNPVASCWHARNYGLMAANPFGRKKSAFPAVKDNAQLVELTKGEHLRLRYGVLIHAGKANVVGIYEEFVKGEKK